MRWASCTAMRALQPLLDGFERFAAHFQDTGGRLATSPE